MTALSGVTATDRLIAGVSQRLEQHRASLDATPDLNSVTLIVQLNRHGPGKDKVLLRTEAGHLTNGH